VNERTKLCRSRTLVGSDTAYMTNDGIDLDQSVNYEVVRRRVFFDDVQLVTLHRERGMVFMVLAGAWGLLWTAIAIFIVAIDTDAWEAALVFLALGAPAVIGFLLRLALGREVVTIFGRRSKASLRFGVFRKQRARDVYGTVCAAVRRAQGRAARAEMPAPEALTSDVPMPPG
jgi:hypothetical protein